MPNESNVPLTKHEKALLSALLTRIGRKKFQCCRCEGVRAVGELLTHKRELLRFLVSTPQALSQIPKVESQKTRVVSEAEFFQFSATVTPQGVIAVADIPEFAIGIPDGEFVLAFDGLSDPGNLGTISRTFRAIGGKEIWYVKGAVDPWCDKAIRSGLGAQFDLKFRRFDTLSDLCDEGKKWGYDNFFYADPHRGDNCFKVENLFNKSIILIGGEANGASALPPTARSVIIPMPGNYESLNAAQAATVILVEYVRRITT